MGNFDLVVIVNGWFTVLVKGTCYESERQAIDLVMDAYYKRKYETLNDEHCDPDFNWEVSEITAQTVSLEISEATK